MKQIEKMNLLSEILKEHSKSQTLKIVKWVGWDKQRFKQLMLLFLEGEYRVTQRSAWMISTCADNHPELIRPYLKKMILKTQEPGVHDAVKRNVVRILQKIEIPVSLTGRVTDICFNFLADKKEAIAVRVFSMTVLYHITKKEPDLRNELRWLIEESLPEEKAAFKSRGKKILKNLK